jgi:transcriptional regulator
MYGHPKTLLSYDELTHTLARFRRQATLITGGASGLKATQLALMYVGPRDPRDRKDLGRLIGRMALANDQWADAQAGAIDALVLLPSPDTAGLAKGGWHFETVHAYGKMTLFRDEKSLRSILASLSDRPEVHSWKPGQAPVDEIERQIGGIIGVEIDLERATAKRRLAEDRTDEDRAAAIAAAEAADAADERQLADMR